MPMRFRIRLARTPPPATERHPWRTNGRQAIRWRSPPMSASLRLVAERWPISLRPRAQRYAETTCSSMLSTFGRWS